MELFGGPVIPSAEDLLKQYPEMNWRETGGAFGRARLFPYFAVGRLEDGDYVVVDELGGVAPVTFSTFEALEQVLLPICDYRTRLFCQEGQGHPTAPAAP